MDIRFLILAVFIVCSHGKKKVEVCSSKGVKYKNKCSFLEATCKPDDRSFDNVTMARSCDTLISKKQKANICVLSKDGNSVITKQLCEILKAKCKKIVYPAKYHDGVCEKCDQANVCPWERHRKGNQGKRQPRRAFWRLNVPQFKVCANDGSTYNSICDYHIARCQKYKKDKLILKMRMCPHGKKKGNRKEEVCSTEGVKYANKCAFLKDTCRPDNSSYDSITLAKCSGVSYRKRKANICVLSEDGKSVETRQHCEFHKAKCEQKALLRRYYSGVCGNCKKDNVCPYDKRRKANPGMRQRRSRFRICVDDGSSYKSICDYHVAKCKRFKKDGTILKVRKCFNDKKKGSRKREKGNQREEVCSSLGVKYPNKCAFLKDTCKPNNRSYDGITMMKCRGVNHGKRKSNICVLSEDGKSVETRQHCEYYKAKCEKKSLLRRFYSGVCGNCEKDNVCPYDRRRRANPGIKIRRSILQPRIQHRSSFRICADDGSSYKSICDFHVAKCKKYKEGGIILKLLKTGRRRGPIIDCKEEARRTRTVSGKTKLRTQPMYSI